MTIWTREQDWFLADYVWVYFKQVFSVALLFSFLIQPTVSLGGKVSWETPQCVTSAVAPVARVSWPTFPFGSLLTHRWCPEKSWVQFHILLLITHAPGHTKSTPLHVSMRYQIHVGSESNADMVRHLPFCICSKFLSNWCHRLIQKLVNWVTAEIHSHSKVT